MQRQDVGVLQGRLDPDLAKEPLGAEAHRNVGPEDLQRDLAFMAHVVSEVDVRRTPATKLAEDHVPLRDRRLQAEQLRCHDAGHLSCPWPGRDPAALTARDAWRVTDP